MYIHSLLRPIFDNEVYKESNRSSKFFPHYYTHDRLPDYTKHVFHDCQGYDLKTPSSNKTAFIAKAISYFNKKNFVCFSPDARKS